MTPSQTIAYPPLMSIWPHKLGKIFSDEKYDFYAKYNERFRSRIFGIVKLSYDLLLTANLRVPSELHLNYTRNKNNIKLVYSTWQGEQTEKKKSIKTDCSNDIDMLTYTTCLHQCHLENYFFTFGGRSLQIYNYLNEIF